MAQQTRTQRQAAAKKAAATRKQTAAKRSVAERALLIPVGAALEARDRLAETVRTYADPRRLATELNRFERRGERALRRRRRNVERQVTSARRDFERRTNGLKADAEDVVDRVRQLA
jgi:hypothetical protein